MRSLLVSGLFVSFGLFVGRLSGFGREAFIASKFGASEQTDLIIVFLSAPDVLVNLLMGGALGMALIPEFKSLDAVKAKVLYQQVLVWLVGSFGLLSICASFFSAEILSAFAPGLSDDIIGQYGNTFAITFVAIPLTVAAGITTAFLQYRGQFLIPALGTLIFNLTLISSLYFSSSFGGGNILLIISLGVCCAALIRWCSQVLNSRVIPFNFNVFNESLVSAMLLRRYFYGVLTGGVIFLMPVVTRAIASESGPGQLSLVNYSIKLVEFPLGVVLTVFSIIFFPRFSGFFSENREAEFIKILKSVMFCVLAIAIAVFLPLRHFSASVVAVTYDWGQLNIEQLDDITTYFYSAVRTLPFQGINALLIAVLAARKDTISALLCSTSLAVLFFIMGYFVVTTIDELFDLMVLTYALLSISLIFILIFKHRVNFIDRKFSINCLKLLLVAFVYFWLISKINITPQDVWVDLLVICTSSIMFLTICIFINKDIRQIIKI
jgi:putative peptidoglycan lipid II flippase